MIQGTKWLLDELKSWHKSQAWEVQPSLTECIALFAEVAEVYYKDLSEEYNENLIEEARYVQGSVCPEYFAPTTGAVFGYEFTFADFCRLIDMEMFCYSVEEYLDCIPEEDLKELKRLREICNLEALSVEERDELYFYYEEIKRYNIKKSRALCDEYLPF